MSCEVVNVLPLICPWADIAHLELAEKLFIPVCHCAEFDPLASFHHRLRVRVKHDFAIEAITHPKLLAEDHESTVRAITQEYARFVRAKHKNCIRNLINGSLCRIIVQIEVSIIAFLNLERRPVEVAWVAYYELFTFIVEHNGS